MTWLLGMALWSAGAFLLGCVVGEVLNRAQVNARLEASRRRHPSSRDVA